MAEYDFIKMQKKLAKYLDEDRYEHTLGVMFTCAALAMVHDCDCLLYTSPSPRDKRQCRMPSSA